MKRMAMLALGLLAAATTASAGNVCTWTGAGRNANWSNAANWDVMPVSGNGDTLVFTNADDIVCVNDSASFSLSRLYCSGPGKVTFATGGANAGEIKFALNGTSFTNVCNVVFDVPVRIANNVTFLFVGGASFNGEITIQGSYTLYFKKTDAILPVIAVNGGVTGADATFGVYLGRNVRDTDINDAPFSVNAPIRVKKLNWAGDYKNVFGIINVPGSEWQQGLVGYGYCYAGCENAYATNMVMSWNNYYNSAAGIWNLNGFNQTIDRIWSDTYPTNGSGVLYNGGDRIVSELAATLTMRATGDGRCWGMATGAVSFVWAPLDPQHTLDFDNREHLTTGDLYVSNGTMKVSRAGTFAHVGDIRIGNGATFFLDSTASRALADARNLIVEGSGTFKMSSTATDPFAGVRVWMDAGAKLHVPAGTTLAVGSLSVGGAAVADDTYSGTGWIDGGGSVQVDSSRLAALRWARPVDGGLADDAKWTGGHAPAAADAMFVDAAGEPYTVTVADGTSTTGPLTVGGSATFAPAGTFTQTQAALAVGRGGKIDLQEGSEYVFTSSTSWRDPTVVAQVSGGEIALSGGSFTADPFYGRFVIGGSDLGSRGRLSISSGTFTFCGWQGGSGAQSQQTMRILGGGLVDVSDTGVFFCKAYGWGTIPLLLEGGEIVVSDHGEFQINGQTQYVGGYGKITFTDDATLGREDASQKPGFYFIGRGKHRTLEVLFTGRSKLDLGSSGSFAVQSGLSNSRSSHPGSGVTLTLDSEAEHSGGAVTVVGGYAGPGVLNMKRGKFTIGGQGLAIGISNAAANGTALEPDGTVNVSGGIIDANGSWAWETTATYLSGVILGNPFPAQSSNFPKRICKGTLNISGDGVVSNRSGCVVVGVGFGVGRVSMTGGAFAATDRSALSVNVLGFMDGTGTWTQTAGSTVFSNSVFVGGVDRAAFKNGAKLSVGDAVDTAAAHGIVDVFGGSFTTWKDLVLGARGVGDLTVGGTGVVAARDLVVSNALSAITIVADERGVGRIRLSGDIDAANGSVLIVDAIDYPVDATTRSVDVLTYATASSPFSEIVLKGDAKTVHLVRSPGRIKLSPIRGFSLTIR